MILTLNLVKYIYIFLNLTFKLGLGQVIDFKKIKLYIYMLKEDWKPKLENDMGYLISSKN